MKRVNLFAILAFAIIFTSNLSVAQFGWTPISTGTNNNLNSIFFVVRTTGYIAGDQSTILKSTTAGNNWFALTSPENTNYTGIYFIDANTGFVVGELGKILKTTNGGLNWVSLNTGLNKNFYDVYFSQNTGYVIGEDGIILKTSNSGVNWIQQNSQTNYVLKKIRFFDSQNGYITGGNSAGYPALILKTTNGGINWSVQLYPSFYSFNNIFFCNSGTGFVVGSGNGSNGMCGVTVDGGMTWNFPVQNITYPLNGQHFLEPAIGFAVGNNGTIVTTTNGGYNWSYESSGVTSNLRCITYNSSAFYTVGSGGILLKKAYSYLKAHLNNVYKPNCGRVSVENIRLTDSLCTGTIDSIWWYVNGQFVSNQHSFTYTYPQGTSFVKMRIKSNQGSSDSALSTVTRSIFKTSTAGPIFGGSSLIGDSVLYTISTGNAVLRMDINGNVLYSLQVGGDILSSCSIGYDTSIFMTSTDCNLYGFSRFGAPLWPALPLGAPAICTPTVDSANNMLYVGVTNNNFIAINKNSGTVAWSYFADAPVKTSAIVSEGKRLFFASCRGTLYGFNLSAMAYPPAPNWTLQLNDSILVSPAVDYSDNFYVGSRSGKLYKIGIVSNSAYIIWQKDLGSAITTSVTIDADTNIYVGTADSKLYCIKSDGVVKWYYLSNGSINSTPAISYTQTVYFANDVGEVIGLDQDKNIRFYYQDSAKISCPLLCQKGSLYIGSVTGKVQAFYDSLESMSYYRGGVKSVPVWGVFQNNPMRTGILRKDKIIGIINHTNSVVDQYELRQNYPNPFNPSTKIGFSIIKSGIVKIRIFDITGREVNTLINQKLGKGTYEITWQASNMPSGVYFYRLEAGEYTQTKKMIILK